jgi:hypothetical protein
MSNKSKKSARKIGKHYYLFTLTVRFITADDTEFFVFRVKKTTEKANWHHFVTYVGSSAIDTLDRQICYRYLGRFHTGFVHIKGTSVYKAQGVTCALKSSAL